MRLKISVSVLAFLVLALTAFSVMRAEDTSSDPTVTGAVVNYVPNAKDLAYIGPTAGDTAEIDVQNSGTALDYIGVVLNGDGANANGAHPFLKVQAQSANGNFSNAACYLGNNGSAGGFGLNFFTLTQQFNKAHMRASRSGSTVTLKFTLVNGGALPDQTYTCSGAPTAVGDKIGINGYSATASSADNFSDGTSVKDTFSYTGPLASSGNWTDAAPGMVANGSVAKGTPSALSFFTGTGGGICPATVAVSDVPDGSFILATLYRFRDEVMAQSAAGRQYIDMFYRNTTQASWILMRNSGLRTRVATMLWKQQSTLMALIQHQPATIRSADLTEIDNIIGVFLFSAGANTSFAADLRTVRQAVRDRSALTQFGVRLTD
jgi:hypothetical protein